MENKLVQPDPSAQLKRYTHARIGLGNVGGALPTNEVLSFKLAHAEAKDAVVQSLNITGLYNQFCDLGLPVFRLKSRVKDRTDYLQRPDLGRRLDQTSVQTLIEKEEKFDLVFVVADGLSAEAVNQYSVEVIKPIVDTFRKKYKIAIALVEQGRVAVADEIGELLSAKLTSILIGERPGLSSPRSMGIYTTFSPKVGLTDERRNCISNIHNDGLTDDIASKILFYYIQESLQRKYSGVNLHLDLNLLKLLPTDSQINISAVDNVSHR